MAADSLHHSGHDMTQITEYLNEQQLRSAIAQLVGVPNERVLKWGVQQDVSALNFFITLQINPSASLANNFKFNKIQEKQTIEAQKETTAIVGFHGKNAFVMAEFFQAMLISIKADQLFDIMKIGLVRTSDVQNLTIPFGAGYEERAQITLTLSHNFTIEYQQNRIETIDIGLVLNQ